MATSARRSTSQLAQDWDQVGRRFGMSVEQLRAAVVEQRNVTVCGERSRRYTS
jgi:hypothetical protein